MSIPIQIREQWPSDEPWKANLRFLIYIDISAKSEKIF